MASCVAVIGPVGCGKSELVKQYFSDRTFIDPDSETFGFSRAKNTNIMAALRRAIASGEQVVITNGGGLFTSDIDRKAFYDRVPDLEIVVPEEIFNFLAGWKEIPFCRTSMRDVKNGVLMTNIFRTISENHRANAKFQALKKLFVDRTISTCTYRLDVAKTYSVGYYGDQRKIGHFRTREHMLETMTNKTIENFEHQFVMVIWARLNNIPIVKFSYDDETHQVSI
jgi:hypothetical protein